MNNTERWIKRFEHFLSTDQNAKEYCEAHTIGYSTFRRHAKELQFNIRAKAWPKGKHPHSKMQLSSQASMRHGVYSFIKTGLIPCDGCLWRDECKYYEAGESCKILAEFQSVKMQELMELPHIKAEDASMVEMAVREMAIQSLIMRFTSGSCMFHTQKGGEQVLQPIMNQYWCSVSALSRILSKLGLDPISRKQLNIDSGEAFNLAQAIIDAE